jgi:hypothetical protein
VAIAVSVAVPVTVPVASCRSYHDKLRRWALKVVV